MKKLYSLVVIAGIWILGGCGSSGPQPIAVTITSPTAPQAIDQGQSVNITATVANDALSKGVTWTLTGPGALASQTTSGVTYNAPASGIAATATVTAASAADPTKTAALMISVTPIPAISTTTLPPATEGTPYNQTISSTGGAGTLNFTVSVGALPAGLTLSSAGVISGTPTGPNGTTNFTVKLTDSSTVAAQSASQALSIVINLPPPPAITNTTLPAGVEGTAYTQTITATGGLTPYTFSISSVTGLPAGLSMNTSGNITGTPTGPNGTSNFTVKVTDKSNPAQSATQALSITVNLPPPPSITTASLPAGVEGTAYNQTIAATGGLTPYAFTITLGTLPAGLSMNTSGNITGTPTGPNGVSNFTVTVTDSSNPKQTGSKSLSIAINLQPPPVISPTSLPNGNVGTPYNQTLTVTAGLGPTFTWIVSSGTLPAGLTLVGNNTTATISGTPTTAQNNVGFTVQVTDSSVPPQLGTQNYTVTINPPTPLTITTNSPLPQGVFNAAYNTTITAAGGIAPYTFSLDSTSNPLPAGLGLTNSSNQGVISGTPTTAGTFTIIVDVTDSALPTAAIAKKTFTLVITAPAIIVSPSSASLPSGTQSTAYTTSITASGGVSPYTFSLDATSAALPAGLGFSSNASSATLSGTPTATGTTTGIIVDVKDSEQPAVTVKQTYSITINSSTPPCGTGSESKLNGQYAFLLQGFDGSGPVAIAGSFTANGAATNNITGGQEDINRNIVAGVTNPTITTAGSSYSIGADNRGCLTLVTGSTTSSYRFSLGSFAGTPSVATKGHIVSFDATGTNVVGVFEKQDSAAFSGSAFAGDFAFGASSPTLKSGAAARFGVAGRFTASGGNITAAEADVNDNGTPMHVPSFTGTYTVAANGRGTITLTPGGNPVQMSFYIVSASEALIMSIDPQIVGVTANSLFAGSSLKQSGTPFTNSALSAPSVISIESTGSMAGTSSVQVGLLTGNSAGSNITFSADQNDGGVISTNAPAPATYSVAGNGRVTLTNAGTHPPFFYLVTNNEGFLIGTGGSVETGFFEPQAAGPFNNASLSGNYFFGDEAPVVSSSNLSSGVVTADGLSPTGTVSVTNDQNQSGTLTGGQTSTATYSAASNGRVTIGSGTDTNVMYIISSSKAVLISTKISPPKINPTITVVEK